MSGVDARSLLAEDTFAGVSETLAMGLEQNFNPTFTTALALREKQIQQNYRPIIGIHKWFARRPGTVFRSLLLAEFAASEDADTAYWHSHQLRGVVADPFMGGGTPLFEANRLGFSVVGADVNPMAYWVVRQSLAPLDLDAFCSSADMVASDVERQVGELYETECVKCGEVARVKYFLWVKAQECPVCGEDNDLFPGYLLAEATRHPRNVLVCSQCGTLNEFDRQPTRSQPEPCAHCLSPVYLPGPARRNRVECRTCKSVYSYPPRKPTHPPRHRMWAMEYHCESCKPTHQGRFFKRPDSADLARFERAGSLFAATTGLPIPGDEIPSGDETDRLHRWGYWHYQEMFNERQLLGLGLLLRRICECGSGETRHALLTVFSDFLRYQNMLCRYDTYALKCQDIFSVHGFPVGLVQCENNLLGIPRVGSGSFRHFVQKYLRAKRYCEAPFETRHNGRRKRVVPIDGERIQARLVGEFPSEREGQAFLLAATATEVPLPPASLDGVFTDPPYYANVQYAELMDFCFAWLRLGLRDEFVEFRERSTRTPEELTGNITLGRGMGDFTAGLSAIFRHYAAALKPGAPFVFTYHHNDPSAYSPLVVAILDAGLDCTATLPAAAEMTASLHIAGTGSSVLDSVFVCRATPSQRSGQDLKALLVEDITSLAAAGMRLTEGDIRCLAAGHIARMTVNQLCPTWDAQAPLTERAARVEENLAGFASRVQADQIVTQVLEITRNNHWARVRLAASV